MPREQRTVLDLAGMDVGGELERDLYTAWQRDHVDEARALVAIERLLTERHPGPVPPLRHRRVPLAIASALVGPHRQVDGGPHPLPGHVVERDGAVRGTQVLADRQVSVVRADPELVLPRPELERPRVDVEEDRPPEAGTQLGRNTVRHVEEEAVTRSPPERLGREANVLDGT